MVLRAALLAVVLLCAAPAGAAAVQVELVKTSSRGAVPSVKGDGGMAAHDVLELRVTGGEEGDAVEIDGLRVASPGALTAGSRCRADAPGTVVCDPRAAPPGEIPGPVETMKVELGGGDDRLRLAALPGLSGSATVRGGAGADVLVAPPLTGAMRLSWDGGAGADRLEGGAGWEVSYAERTGPVAVTLDGVANDGEAGEGDDAGGAAARLTGGSGSDTLVGGAEPVLLVGGAGDDTLRATGNAVSRTMWDTPLGIVTAHSTLSGGDGADRLLGGPGPDLLHGEQGNDVLAGGDGGDGLVGGPGSDAYDGGPGDDQLGLQHAGDGAADAVAGGPGRDRAVWEEGRVGLSYAVTLDGRGPDGPVGEPDALAADVEDVRVATTSPDDRRSPEPTVAVTGDAGPNRLDVVGSWGTVTGGAGDDELRVFGRYETAIRVDLGPGRDRIAAGQGLRIAARDGEVDTIACDEVAIRALDPDPDADRVGRCVKPVMVNHAAQRGVQTLRRGGRALVPLSCADLYNACRARVRLVLTREGTRAGRALGTRTVTIPATKVRRLVVRLPRDVRVGRRVVRVAAERASPFPGAAARRTRGEVRVRVRR